LKKPQVAAAEVLNEMKGLRPIVALRKEVQQIRRKKDVKIAFS